MTAPTVTAWAIKAPSGKIRLIADEREDAIYDFVGIDIDWESYYVPKGYRCVRVQITEMEAGK